ncbi:MAG TPA: hypothetical protein VMH81_38750 [Bryobacteraceae bacterium]|nr:hypothetical protein [Bryobacteraceae bacterium]
MIEHLSHDALTRYFMSDISSEEMKEVWWHLVNCPTCREAISVRDWLDVARLKKTAPHDNSFQ